MIPGSFQYQRPATVAEAVALLVKKSSARPLAGGHSLLPMMKLRMAEPSLLVDLGGISRLKGIKVVGKKLIIGAMTTQHELIASALAAKHAPILRETALLIADPQVRYMGTIGGNVANGDPGNDMPAVMMALDAEYAIAGKKGSRRAKARDYYRGPYETALERGEIVTAIEVPLRPKRGFAYDKLKRKVGDYATAAAAVIVSTKGGKIESCSIALTNLGGTPLLASKAAGLLVGKSISDEGAVDAAVAAARSIMEPANDTRGTQEYRIAVGGTVVRKAIRRALARA